MEHANQTLNIWEEQARWRAAEARGDDLALLAHEMRQADLQGVACQRLAVSEIADAFKDDAPALCRRHIRNYTRILNEWDDSARVVKNDFANPLQWAHICATMASYPLWAFERRKILKSILAATMVKQDKAGGKFESISETDVENARAVAIEGLYSFERLKLLGGRLRACCPFHTEKTGSFFIFKDNKFRCFGCGEHGDAIDFIMKTSGYEFLDAVKYLVRK